ncbi:MAG TPA: DUF2147 domain-containing protein [Flavobacteriaceae bacterium]|nr:DUF2147 domain-containing protein [Flavobacteriaceae bacterium]
MKKTVFTGFFLLFGILIYGQTPLGVWKTIDDETKEEKSYVKIYETEDETLEGQIVKILTPGREDAKCTKCSGDKKDKPIDGMIILWGLEKSDSDTWKGGTILDPNNGKEYKAKITLKDENTLEVRGYIGISLFGRTQTWYREE